MHVYKVFPITIGFWKYIPLARADNDFFGEVGLAVNDFFVIGEFIGGNWRQKRCNALGKDKRCMLQLEGIKPLQCSLIPFSAIFDESVQDRIIQYQRANVFKKCGGFLDNTSLIWQDGVFVDKIVRDNFYQYRNLIRAQRPFMMSVIKDVRRSSSYRDFLYGKHGIFEVPIFHEVFEEFLILTGIGMENKGDFINHQKRLLKNTTNKEDVFSDSLKIYETYES
ncbi:MAG: hypothetical protein N3A62_02180 [Thermodesulfovibrionales bacterium]|nr:hypothetical protein [Thermodesulfovibrionales bacterium]